MTPSKYLLLACFVPLMAGAQSKVDFVRDVEPILAQKCHSCHDPKSSRQACASIDARTPCGEATTVPSSSLESPQKAS